VLLALLFTLILASNEPAAAQDYIRAFPLAVPVTLDGKYTSPAKWSDTSELQPETEIGVVAFFSAKYDPDYLYAMWDFAECTRLQKTSFTVDESMYRVAALFAYTGGEIYTARGTATGEWTTWNPQIGAAISTRVQRTSSPHKAMNHCVMEVRVALTFAD